jgi:hypothetical protein
MTADELLLDGGWGAADHAMGSVVEARGRERGGKSRRAICAETFSER